MTLGKPSIWWISPIVPIIDPFITFTVHCLPVIPANNEHHNPLPLPPFLFICLCRYYSTVMHLLMLHWIRRHEIARQNEKFFKWNKDNMINRYAMYNLQFIWGKMERNCVHSETNGGEATQIAIMGQCYMWWEVPWSSITSADGGKIYSSSSLLALPPLLASSPSLPASSSASPALSAPPAPSKKSFNLGLGIAFGRGVDFGFHL